ncbi:uncharacterized protein Z520_01728 [Fonsecaea multimorphosa CBS 102226]|uniref:ELYS-like domain-containing protein n=1 Tax=Fonsecaea multimorphosa CBS 102226 TaxID=1442371 RepID=A0A0D2HN48_9EURO|nr:uncharacterized protein Z520_01728 [Fonsecaea multimorphosa CBS 102226]KIY03261.1 hypothetical protein Z520_01728 [Fonsecaea multimorphosa CBS 102226]OAL30180.1 hypothetical protein AYO22_01696 [Fonsecaea multimorphosa]
MLNWHDFDAVFQPKADYAYDARTVESIIKHRKEFGDQLFFDRIWRTIGLTRPARNNYPPRSNQDLRNLWSKIVQSTAPEEQKLALLYYLLRDCRQLQNADLNFARRTHLPQRWQLLMAGLWELDHAQFSRALEHLTDPSLTPTFTDEILLTLLRHPKCEPSLATAYYIAMSPPLEDPAVLEAYYELIITNNLVEAYYFAQRQNEAKHKMLFDKLVVAVHQNSPGQSRSERAALLVGLPLTAQEEAWFERCILDGAASKLPGAKDSLMARTIAMGRSTSDSTALSRLKGDSIGGINWEVVRAGIADAVPH